VIILAVKKDLHRMMAFQFINPLETSQHSYESIPDISSTELSSEEQIRFLLPPTYSNAVATKTKTNRETPFRVTTRTIGCILVVVCTTIVISRRLEGTPTSRTTPSRPHFVPTLLSVFDPTNGYVYALNCSLYNAVSNAKFVDADDDYDDSNWTGLELPRLFLDQTIISVGESVTISWSMGRDGESGNILLREDDIIALYCGGKEEGGIPGNHFLEVATISQARATSLKNGGPGDSWYIPSFPVLRQEECYFRLYSATTVSDSDKTEGPLQLVKVATSERLVISSGKETPTAIHLALTESSSKMIVQFTTGEVSSQQPSGTETKPVVRYYMISSHLPQSTSREDFTFVYGTSDTYSSDDFCQAPANQEMAGKFYPPGMLHTIEMDHLEPSATYEYQVGLSVNGTVSLWSDRARFQSSPELGTSDEFYYIVYGDQGCPELGCGEGRRWMEDMVEREPMATAVHHFGDIR
jgi:hypothetical protein